MKQKDNTKKIKETCCEKCDDSGEKGSIKASCMFCPCHKPQEEKECEHTISLTDNYCEKCKKNIFFPSSPDKMVEEGMTKKEFMKMLAEADVDDTTEFWENVYDQVCSTARKEERERAIKLIKEKGLHLGYKNDIINLISNL